MIDVAKEHQKRVARASMRMHCLGVLIMGGPNHKEAAKILGTKPPKGCTCAH
jgi:hypothetical protein